MPSACAHGQVLQTAWPGVPSAARSPPCSHSRTHDDRPPATGQLAGANPAPAAPARNHAWLWATADTCHPHTNACSVARRAPPGGYRMPSTYAVALRRVMLAANPQPHGGLAHQKPRPGPRCPRTTPKMPAALRLEHRCAVAEACHGQLAAVPIHDGRIVHGSTHPAAM